MGRVAFVVILFGLIALFIRFIAFVFRCVFGIIAMIFGAGKKDDISENRFENLGRKR